LALVPKGVVLKNEPEPISMSFCQSAILLSPTVLSESSREGLITVDLGGERLPGADDPAYSLWLKTRLLVDVMVLAGLYTLRIIAGAQAVDVPLTMWLLAFSMFVFLSLAFVKRYSELIEAEHLGGEEACGRNYRVSDLRIIEAVGPASGYLAVVVFCNYLNSDMVRNLYRHPQVLWLVAPLLLYWLTRVWFLARRRAMHEDAILFALHDRVSILTAVLSILVVIAAGPRAGIIVGAN
jgi:4-hydroxybenzoate polyprenyltransferase